MKTDSKCCDRDTDGDGNCPVHSAPGIYRNKALNPPKKWLIRAEDDPKCLDIVYAKTREEARSIGAVRLGMHRDDLLAVESPV